MNQKPPWALRVLRFLDFFFFRFLRLWAVVRDQVAWAVTTHEMRTEVTCSIYSGLDTFSPGGELFNEGLFPWEKELLASGLLPAAGRVLLGGAGGGREMRAFCDRGFSVCAFEPAAGLASGAERAVKECSEATFLRASYEDFVREMSLPGGRFRNWIEGKPVDLVWLGYGSLPHVTEAVVRSEILKTARAAAPSAPIVLSALVLDPSETGRLGRFRERMGSWLRRVGCRDVAGPGDGFSFHGGFYHQFTRTEVERLASEAGCELALYRVIPQGQFCAVFIPGDM